jgi:hypothetical protein
MHLPTVARPVRVRRLLAVSAAAAVVVLAPLAGTDDPLGLAEPSGHHAGHTVGDGRSGDTAQRVVPVGKTADAEDAADSDDAADSEDSDSRDTGDNDSADAQNDDDEGDAKNDDDAAESKNDDAKNDDAKNDDEAVVPPGGKDGNNNGLDVLGRDCSESDLDSHDGFQKSPACVSTQMGEVAAEDKLPSLLITDAPDEVEVDESFELKVSTRNLVRDRFLGAAEGGYYLESSFLNSDGLQRGHFHTACRLLSSTDEAPDSGKDPEFFLATQDNKGGAEPDTVTIEVPGIKSAGDLQCTSWAGDGSHRTPMMTKANETPAIDSVRIKITD